MSRNGPLRPDGDPLVAASGAGPSIDDRFRLLFEVARDAMCIIDPTSGQFLDVNDAMLELYGYSREEFAGLDLRELSAEPGTTDSALAIVLRERRVALAPRRHRKKNGTAFPVEISATVFEADGRLMIAAVIRDVSERFEAERIVYESEARLEALLAKSRDVVAVLDATGVLTYVSPSAPQLFGYPYGSHLLTNVIDMVHPDDRDRALEALAARISTTDARDPLELRVAHADGTWHHIELVSSNLLDDPSVGGIVLNVRDITERRQHEHAVEEGARRLDALLTHSSDLIAVTDAAARITYVSPAVSHMLGYRPDELLGRYAAELVHPDGRPRAATVLERLAATPGLNPPVEVRVRHADGRWVRVEIIANNLLGDPAVDGIVFSARDITERVEFVEELREARNEVAATAHRFETMLANLSDLVSVIDNHGNMTYVSPAARRLVGRDATDRVGASIFEFVHPDDVEHGIKKLRDGVSRPGPAEPFEARLRHEDGSYRVFEVRANNLLDDPSIAGIIVSSRDVTDRVTALAALRESERLHRSIVETADEGIWVIDADEITTFVNARMATMLGYTVEEMIGTNALEFHDTAALDDAKDRLDRRRAGVSEHVDWRFTRRDGTVLWAIVSASPIIDDDGGYAGAIALVTDITERRATEQALHQAELEHQRQQAQLERHRLEVELERARRLETIGQLTAGVSHDFNNVLGIISHYATLAAKQLPEGRTREDITRILDATRQGRQLTERLALISEPADGADQPVAVDEAARAYLELVRETIGESIRIDARWGARGARVRLAAGGIERILLNLLLNARDAMPAGGSIEIGTRVEGAALVLTVRDRGVGMSDADVRRALEPFYSTKTLGKGSGLGLPTVVGVVEHAGGALTIDSVPGAGTTVCVRLPVDGAAPGTSDSAAEARTRIVVVDDEPELLHLTALMLETSGYEVTCARDSDAALRAFASGSGDLLLADVRMPGTDGTELARRVRATFPHVAVVLMSGYREAAAACDASDGFLQKPFTEAELLDAVAAACRKHSRS